MTSQKKNHLFIQDTLRIPNKRQLNAPLNGDARCKQGAVSQYIEASTSLPFEPCDAVPRHRLKAQCTRSLGRAAQIKNNNKENDDDNDNNKNHPPVHFPFVPTTVIDTHFQIGGQTPPTGRACKLLVLPINTAAE